MGNPKIIVTLNGEPLRELSLDKDRITIGRRPYNDLVLENPAVSGEHADLKLTLNDWMLEDLNSTNGTFVNGQPVKKHFLQNNDTIEIVKYRLLFLDAEHAAALTTPPAEPKPASLTVLTGANAGKSMELTKEITTLGRAGAQVAAIARDRIGYVIKQVEGAAPLVNGKPITPGGHPLINGDVIDLSGTQIQFSGG